MPFLDRREAGELLAAELLAFRGKDAIVLALPRGGLEVALPIADRLGVPLDLLLVRKIGLPHYPEVAMGAIVDGPEPIVVRNDDVLRHAHVSDADFKASTNREIAEIERRKARYLCGKQPLPAKDKIVIVVDDGVATGATLRAALLGLRQKRPAKTIVAIPVAPSYLVEELKAEVDEVVCLEALGSLGAVSQHYAEFDQLSDEDVIDLLAEAHAYHD
jgi:predicted phosphoribosyltransferase